MIFGPSNVGTGTDICPKTKPIRDPDLQLSRHHVIASARKFLDIKVRGCSDTGLAFFAYLRLF
jgi:hypothetical protein